MDLCWRPTFFGGEDAGSWDLLTLLQSTAVAWRVQRVQGKTAATMPSDITTTGCRIHVGQLIRTIHNVDIMVDVADNSLFRNRQLDVMIRNTMVVNSEDDLESDWYHKNWGDDVGVMHTIRTNVDFDKVGTSPYAANGYVLERLLRLLVVSLSQIWPSPISSGVLGCQGCGIRFRSPAGASDEWRRTLLW
jgi:hypothetical protein